VPHSRHRLGYQAENLDEDAGRATAEAAAKTKQLDLQNNADPAWREYKMNLCELQSAGFRGGSEAASAATDCEYRADRQYGSDWRMQFP
jgi:hypothetical protein